MPTLNWIGKEAVVKHHKEVPFRLLEPVPELSCGDADSGNLIVQGDNLHALKALLPRYAGQVKCIYIDPPYNTGNEGWVYNDNVNSPEIRKWLGEVVGKEGETLDRHDRWLSMMYPRLVLLTRFLREDGAIFVSIDDNEVATLRLLMDEIFGARNFITGFIWRKVDSPNDNKVPLTPDHEYVLAYARSKDRLKLAQMSAPGIVDAYGRVDEQGRRYRDRLLKKNGRNSLRRDRPTMYFPLTAPDGSEVYPVHDNGEEARWAMGQDGVARHQAAGTLIWKQRQRQGETVADAIGRRDALHKLADEERRAGADYLRPIVLIQSEPRRAGVETLDFEKVRQELISNHGIPAGEIVVTTGEEKGLEQIDADYKLGIADPACPVKFVITQKALAEGWDCPFAHILVSMASLSSATAVEQLLGRVLRQPGASHRQAKALNQSYAFVVSRNFTETAGALRDRLVAGAGFERREVTEFVTAAKAEQARLDLEGHAGRVVVRPVAITLTEKPDLRSVPKPVRDKVSWDGKLNTLTISTPLTEDEAEVLKASVTSETAAAAIVEAAEISRTTAIEFFQTPAELGERFRVPQLALRVQGELQLFDDPEVLEYPWDLSTYDAAPTGDDLTALGAGLKVSEGGEIDVDDESGKVVSRFLPDLQRDLGLVYQPENWDEVRLATWLCRNLPEPSLIHLEKTKSGAALLQKLSSLPPDDITGVDRLLTEWTVKDALRVLDEIDSRIGVIETIRRLADDPHTDELHTLHPLILRSRWLFGPEFESQEHCSNMTLQTVARELFKSTEAQFINERHRPDIVVLPEKTTWQMTGIGSFDPVDVTLTRMQHVLVIELKKGGFELTRKEINQADGYVQDIAASGAMAGSPYICAWVVGQKIASGVERDKQLGNPAYGRVRAATFGSLVDTANARLLKLRTVLADRYGGSSTDELLNRVFSQPTQHGLGI